MIRSQVSVVARVRTLAFTMLVLIASSGFAVAQKPHTVTVKLATQNVENFFDVFDDPYNRDEGATPKPVEEINLLAKQMRMFDADFFGIQELESMGLLARFVDWQFKDRGYDYIWANQMRAQRGINVGCMSKVPLGGVTAYKYEKLTAPGVDRTWTFARDLASVEIKPASDVVITVFIVHFKSKRDSRDDPKSGNWRLAEALGLRRIAKAKLDADPDALIVAMGDFNDTPDSPPIQALLDTANGGPVFVDPHADIPADQRISYLKEPYRSNIDYVLLSPALAKMVVDGSARVGPGSLDASDHAPVTVTVEIPTAQENARDAWKWQHYQPAIGVFLKRASAPANN